SVTPCTTCGGEGELIEHVCEECSGRGLAATEKSIDIEVPAGVSTGDYITLRGQGNAGPRGGARGDIVVIMEVEDDPRFVRDGNDLVYDLRITFSQAALGTEVEVPTVTGTARLRVPAGTQSGRLL